MPPPKTNATPLQLKRFLFIPVFVADVFTCKVMALCICLLAGISTKMYAGEKIYELKAGRKPATIGEYLYIFKDKKLTYTESDILHATGFSTSSDEIPVASVIEGNTWVRINISNTTQLRNYNFEIEYPVISDIKLFRQSGNSLIMLAHAGNDLFFKERKNGSPNFVFPFSLNQGDTAIFYFRINSIHPLVLPVFIRNADQLDTTISNQNLFFGLYFGIILSIILYNLFLFFSTRDRNYLIYIIYLFFLGFAQVTVSGYGFKFLWPQLPVINMYALVIASALAGITGIMFGIYFLRIWYYYRTAVLLPAFIIVLYFVAIAAVISGNYNLAYSILNYAGSSGGITLFIFAFLIWRKGYKTAYYYFIAWAFFLSGIIIFSFRNLGLLPSNNFTVYILYFGSAIEALLLSFALADRINTLRKEKEESQEFALRISRENEKLIMEQNIVLEQKVTERTTELQNTNNQLSLAMDNLKDAQTQLVEAEKMASLGQLTAGIAHEINNPINFVKANIKPLRLDIEELFEIIHHYNELHDIKDRTNIDFHLEQIYKKQKQIDLEYVQQEIQSLIKGIDDGAERTAEIVRGLRTFSRVDEGELKMVNVHDGIESTLVILKNSIPHYINISRDYQATGIVECFPGKLNQVFMNILTNAIQAIQAKKNMDEPETISIKTRESEGKMFIYIKDTGIGMSPEVKQKIFEPFYTTKEVGEGTGLGMAIVFKIIEKHFGKIDVITEAGKGAEFILTLPCIHPVN